MKQPGIIAGMNLDDCLWSVLVLAEKYDVELESVSARTMDELETSIEAELSTD